MAFDYVAVSRTPYAQLSILVQHQLPCQKADYAEIC
jgi:hypothetical protein